MIGSDGLKTWYVPPDGRTDEGLLDGGSHAGEVRDHGGHVERRSVGGGEAVFVAEGEDARVLAWDEVVGAVGEFFVEFFAGPGAGQVDVDGGAIGQ